MTRMSWRRFGALVAGLSADSRFISAWADNRRRMGALADADASDPDQLRGAF